MSALTNLALYDRGFSEVTAPTTELELEDMSWSAQGGPLAARVNVRGSADMIWEWVEKLRFGVEIPNGWGEMVWWGYIHGVEVRLAGMVFYISLDEMANSIRVVYSEASDAGVIGERVTGSWVTADDSIDVYGTKQAQFSIPDGTSEFAGNMAATILARTKYPHLKATIAKFGGEVTGRLDCRGWFDTLDWQVYETPAGKESYEEIGIGTQDLGAAAGNTKAAESFQLASTIGWDALYVELRCKKVGSPADNLKVEICADSSGSPGTVLESQTMVGSSVSVNLEWHTFTLASREALSPATTYWLVVSRSGAVDASNFYRVDMNESLGYTRGALKLYNGSAWVARSPDADMLFKVRGVKETSAQVEDIGNAGEFLVDVTLDVDSGVYTTPYQDGDRTQLSCMLELLNGGTTNDRRMLAEVLRSRRLNVYEEPAAGGGNDYVINGQGEVLNQYGAKIPEDQVRPGWARIEDAVPSSVDLSQISATDYVFIEEVRYSPQNGLTLRERDFRRLVEVG